MRLPDSFSFRQRPAGAFRWLLHAPVWLYRARLGFLLGQRFLLITHVGRSSGRRYQTVVEVVGRELPTATTAATGTKSAETGTESAEDDPPTSAPTSRGRTWIVCSGTGPDADWYRNLQSTPAPEIQVGSHSFTPIQTFLSPQQAAVVFHAYERAHPRTAAQLLESMGNAYDGTDAGRVAMMADMPMVAFTDPD